jgi:hypothetical protein
MSRNMSVTTTKPSRRLMRRMRTRSGQLTSLSTQSTMRRSLCSMLTMPVRSPTRTNRSRKTEVAVGSWLPAHNSPRAMPISKRAEPMPRTMKATPSLVAVTVTTTLSPSPIPTSIHPSGARRSVRGAAKNQMGPQSGEALIPSPSPVATGEGSRDVAVQFSPAVPRSNCLLNSPSVGAPSETSAAGSDRRSP